MKVVFIGAGNVATHLAGGLYKQSFEIVQVYSRTLESAKELADKVNASPITDINHIITDAYLYIFSVKDSVLSDLIGQMPQTKGIWVHTAGSIPIAVFLGKTSEYGVIYPFQTFSKNRDIDLTDVPVFIEANSQDVLRNLYKVSRHLSEKVIDLPSDKRKYVHLTGVFACNFVNHLYKISNDILENQGIPFDLALPLIEETCAKVHELSPMEAQTGPAVRYDKNVIDKHLAMIEDESIKEIYKLISQNIHDTHQKNDKL